jgi:hypothetical protein
MGVRIYEAAFELHVTIGSDDDQFGGRSCRRSVIYGLRPPSRLRLCRAFGGMCGYRWVERSGPRGHDPEHVEHGLEVGLVEALPERMRKLRSAIAAGWPGDATTQFERCATTGT